MTDMIERGAKVLPDMRGLLTEEDKREYVRDILLAVLDVDDNELVGALLAPVAYQLTEEHVRRQIQLLRTWVDPKASTTQGEL